MRRGKRHWALLIMAVACTPAAGPALGADTFPDLAVALDYLDDAFYNPDIDNFTIEGRRNPLSGGFDFITAMNFPGNRLNFGVGDLRLQGPVSFQVSTGDRVIDTFDFSFQTAANSDALATPLNYQFNTDVGGQLTQANGTLLVDADVSINQFGFYDIQFEYSSRQNVERDGRFADDNNDFDYDVGPINVRGNIFADILSMITTPFFEATGTFNPFASFSGPSSLQQLLEAPSRTPVAALGSAVNSLRDNFIVPNTARVISVDNGDRALPFSASADVRRGRNGAIVPEPTVLLLVMLGLPAVMARPIRRRLHDS